MRIEWGDAGGVIGAAAGVASFVVSLVSIRRANQANTTAKAGNTLADQANQLAKDANGLATQANDKSAESNNIAREANRIAEAANDLATEANRLAQHQNQRETETHDVRWEGDWAGPGQYVLTRRGDSVAIDVVARVTVDDEEVTERAARVEAGESITLDFPQARQILLREQREHRAQQARRRPGPAYMQPYDPLRFRNHFIEKWVQWKTELGAPREHSDANRFASLGDLD
ncbi:hypothetical protein ACIP96_09810 [Streptomyces nigra]|uniref:hypothetical protein n=1 Tax=Streptomyces nigra TaxID=1827580 RepID=UPI00381AA6EE